MGGALVQTIVGQFIPCIIDMSRANPCKNSAELIFKTGPWRRCCSSAYEVDKTYQSQSEELILPGSSASTLIILSLSSRRLFVCATSDPLIQSPLLIARISMPDRLIHSIREHWFLIPMALYGLPYPLPNSILPFKITTVGLQRDVLVIGEVLV